mmetsp:Transcript_31277/g.42219  ORF Transcript_31277/g.42219 Transcript_31277/m.42219 type:complete len:98 (-) Transcript_31277:270-563(-)
MNLVGDGKHGHDGTRCWQAWHRPSASSYPGQRAIVQPLSGRAGWRHSQRPAKTEDPLQAREITSGFLAATMVSTDTARSTSVTLMVPMAEDRRPAKG